MEENTGVTPESSPGIGSQPATVAEPIAEVPQPQKPPKGFVPYQALEEERAKRKELEEQIKNTSATLEEPDEDVYSDEGKVLKGEIKALNERIRAGERKEARREAEASFPVLREKREDFDAFLEDEENKRLSVQNLLASEPPVREGLEKPSGGGQSPPEPKFSNEEIAHLMKTDWKKYEKLLRSGEI